MGLHLHQLHHIDLFMTDAIVAPFSFFHCMCYIFSVSVSLCCDKVESWCPRLPDRVTPVASTPHTQVPKNISVYVVYLERKTPPFLLLPLSPLFFCVLVHPHMLQAS